MHRPLVRMVMSHTTHYQLDTPEGIEEWKSNVPGDGLVYLGEDKQPFTIALMHQLRCLDIIRDELVRETDEDPSALARHCMNYIKQMIFCREDIQLERFWLPNKADHVFTDQVYECRDWQAVLEKMKENQREHLEWN